ncbi:hypothetical protein KY285_026862 [Solanum tuberosum]|nr:hypothetical protein KY285_026862 [Solanum tuberosum]
MGRNKIVMKKIEDPGARQQFYSKRKGSIVKKSNELGILCDTDIALLMFSPTGEVTTYSSGKSFEDIMINAMKQPDELNRRSYEPQVEHINTVKEADAYKQYLLGAMERIQRSKAKLLANQEFLQRNENVAMASVNAEDIAAAGNESSYSNA